MQSTSNKPKKEGEDFSLDKLDDFVEMLFSPVSLVTGFIKFIGETIYLILLMACIPALVLMRPKNVGMRAYNLYLFLGGSAWFWVFAAGLINLPQLADFHVQPLLPNGGIFTVVGIAFFTRMFWQLIVRKFLPIDTENYSKYGGDPLPFLYWLPCARLKHGGTHEYLVRQIYEPLFLLVLGSLVMVFVNPETGSWLIISALGIAVKEMVDVERIRNQFMDKIDADIIAQSMIGAFENKSPRDNNHVYIAGMPTKGKFKETLIDKLKKRPSSFSATAANDDTANKEVS